MVTNGLLPRSLLRSYRRASFGGFSRFILPVTLGFFLSFQPIGLTQSDITPPPANMTPEEALDYLFGDPDQFIADFNFTLTEYLNEYFGIALAIFCFSLVLNKL